MKKTGILIKALLTGVAMLFCTRASAADGVWTNAASGNWSDAAKWVDGVIAGESGSAVFKAGTGNFTVTNDLGLVTLSGIAINPEAGQSAIWHISGGTNALVAPAVISSGAGELFFDGVTLSSSADLLLTGPGRNYLGQNNLLSGRTVISNGNVLAQNDSAFGPVPDAPVADALILDGGGVMNGANNFSPVIHANRGITLTAAGGYLGAGFTNAGLLIDPPVTGPGTLHINYQNCAVTLNNTASDYSGGTVVGVAGPGSGGGAGYPARLILGSSEVLPHGAAAGALTIAGESSLHYAGYIASVDLNGKTETVNTVLGGPRATITSAVAGAGRLAVGALDDDSDFRGTLSNRATLEKQGAGTLYLGGANVSDGVIDLKAGSVQAGGANLGKADLLFDGGDLDLIAPSGFYEFSGTSPILPDLGAALTYTGWQPFPAKGTGNSTVTFPFNTQFVYRGRWHVQQAGVYSFAKAFDDGGYLKIDGVPLIHNDASGAKVVTNNVAISAGWHDLEIRFSQGSGGVGPNNGFYNGILYDPTNSSFATPAQIAAARVFTDNGGRNLVAAGYDNLISARLLLEQDAVLSVGADAGALLLAGIVTTNSFSLPEPTLTILNNNEPVRFGSGDTLAPAVLDADIASSGGLILTNNLWLRRLPSAAYAVAASANLFLDGNDLLNGALVLSNFSATVVNSTVLGGDGSVTVLNGNTLTFSTLQFADKALSDGPDHVLEVANDFSLSGSTALFSGQGAITYSGDFTGAGTVEKRGSGTTELTGTGSALSGAIVIREGTLTAGSETVLGGAAVTLAGGALSNKEGTALTLDTTPVTAQSGALNVTADDSMTINTQITGAGPISKTGSGTLIIGGTSGNPDLALAVSAGALELGKTGAADAFAVKYLSLAAGTAAKLTGSNGNQIGGNVTLSGGILDLNGRNETIGGLSNGDGGGTVLNNGAAPATLSVGDGNASSTFSGTLADGSGGLALTKIGAGKFTTVPASLAYSGDTDVNGGTLEMKTQVVPVAIGLSYHLDAANIESLTLAGSKVIRWNDSSPAAVNFTQTTSAQQPVYVKNAINGLPAVRFSDTASNRLYANKNANAQTVFIVAKTTSYGTLDGIWGRSGNDYGIRGASLGAWTHPGNTGDFTYSGGAMYINGKAGNTYNANEAYVLTVVRVSAYNDTLHAVGNYWATSSGAGRYFRGYIGEVLVYDRALSAAERDAVTAYLNAKWFALPFGLSYRLDASVASTITLDGTKVTGWADTTAAAVNFSQTTTAAHRPEYVANAINGLPAVRFSDTARNRMVANKNANAQSVFIVAKTTSYGGLDGIWGQSSADNGIRAEAANRWQHPGNGADWSFDPAAGGAMYINGVAGNSYNNTQPYILNSVRRAPLSMTQAIGDYWSSGTYNRYFRGYIGEVLVFERALSTAERLRVNDYLAEKWLGTEPEADDSISTPVNIAADATFKVNNFNLGVAQISGSGDLMLEYGAAFLADYSGFTGTVSGDGAVALAATDGVDATFLPKSMGVTIRNDGALDTDLVVGGSGTNIFIGSMQDGGSRLGFVHSGTGTTLMSGENSTYTGDTVIENGVVSIGGAVFAKLIRFTPLDMRDYGSNLNSGCQYSEFRLMFGGVELAYPVGTLASSVGGKVPDAPQGPNLAIDFNVTTKYYENPARALVIELPEPMLFDGYSWYTANDATGRDAVEWMVEVSDDGVIWRTVDYRDYNGNQAAITLTRNTLAGAWTFSQALSANILSDDSATTLASPAVLAIGAVSETIGALSGDGNITLQGATLGLNTFTDATFSGSISGSGTIVKRGDATQVLSGTLSVSGAIIVEAGVLDLTGAVLTGITNIIIRSGGELTGSATVNGALTVTFEGGVYSATLHVSGALTTSGTVTLAVAEGATFPVSQLLFTYASVDAATQEALVNAVLATPLPEGYILNVRVTASSARLVAAPAGTLILLK